MTTKKILSGMILFLLSFTTISVAGEPIMITMSPDMTQVIFDGKWSTGVEWKRSSENKFIFEDGTRIILRTAHQDNFIYVLVDAVTDLSLDKGADRAMICFDGNFDKTNIANFDDYCFVSTLGRKTASSLQGGSPLKFNGNFKNISSHPDLIGIGEVSDENDRYEEKPHPSYEFRIPTDIVGRSNIYGFYFEMYEAHSGKMYTWPQNKIYEARVVIPSPSTWGELISPDNSLPEFELIFLAFTIPFVILIIVTRSGKKTQFV